MNALRLFGRICAGGILLLSAACTTVTVTPDTGTPVPANIQTYRSVTLGAVDAQQPDSAYLVGFFREGFVRRLNELKAFDSATDNSPPGPNMLVVTGTLIEVDKGDVALRLFIGMGAGRERAGARLVIKNADGTTLGTFEVHKAYSGGAGIGGASFIDIQDLVKQVGEQAAQSLVDWSQGKLAATN